MPLDRDMRISISPQKTITNAQNFTINQNFPPLPHFNNLLKVPVGRRALLSRPKEGGWENGNGRAIGNVRFFTMGTCFFAATILKDRKKFVSMLEQDGLTEEERDSLWRCCRVSPGVVELSIRNVVNLENFALARTSGRSTLVRFGGL